MMNIILKEISEFDFSNLNVPVLFHEKRTGRSFGTITSGSNSYKFSWQSNLLKPKLKMIRSGIYSIGIDQHFAIIDLVTNAVLINLNLDYFFCDAILCNDFVYVITELEIIKIHGASFEIIAEFELPDVYEGIGVKKNGLAVTCSGPIEIFIT